MHMAKQADVFLGEASSQRRGERGLWLGFVLQSMWNTENSWNIIHINWRKHKELLFLQYFINWVKYCNKSSTNIVGKRSIKENGGPQFFAYRKML